MSNLNAGSVEESTSPTAPSLRGLLVAPIARHIGRWLAEGKLDEDLLERSLSTDARGLVDHATASLEWIPLADGEALLRLATDQLGEDAALGEWASAIVDEWQQEEWFLDRVEGSRRLVDGAGYLVSQASELLVDGCRWQYEGDGDRFSVRLSGIESLTASMKSLLGVCLARLAQGVGERSLDVRFEGVDGDELLVFGEVDAEGISDAESRLHRAALVG